jgi:hypothetical protein
LLRRLALRSGACIVCGVTAMMLMIAAGMMPDCDGRCGCCHRVVRTLGCQAAWPFRVGIDRPNLGAGLTGGRFFRVLPEGRPLHGSPNSRDLCS